MAKGCPEWLMSTCWNFPGKYNFKYVSVVVYAAVEVLMLGYSQVCGRMIGYQVGMPHEFGPHQ